MLKCNANSKFNSPSVFVPSDLAEPPRKPSNLTVVVDAGDGGEALNDQLGVFVYEN